MAPGNGLIVPPTRFLLDTDVVLALIRGNPLGVAIDARFSLSAAPARATISVVTVGELMSFAIRGNWGEEKRSRYDALLQELVWIDLNDEAVLDAYARIDCFAITTGRKLSKNDLWIAAGARATGSTLLTTDKDFDPLHDTWIDRIWIDPNTGKTP